MKTANNPYLIEHKEVWTKDGFSYDNDSVKFPFVLWYKSLSEDFLYFMVILYFQDVSL